MAIDYNAAVLGGGSKPSSVDYNKVYTGVASPKTYTPAPAPTPAPAQEPKLNTLQKASKIAGDFFVGLVSPLVKGAELTWEGLKTTGQVYKAGAQLSLGDKNTALETVKKVGTAIQTERAQPMKVMGREVERITTPKQALGVALELGSFAIGGGEAMAAKNILKTSLTQGLKIGSQQAAKRVALGAAAGGIFSAGAAIEEDKNLGQVGKEFLKGAAIGSIFELGILGAGVGASAARKSLSKIVEGAKPQNLAEKMLAKEGDETLPKSIKVGEQITNAHDPSITYEKSVNLGKDANGKKMLSRTEFDPTTGKVKVFIDKSLDNNPGLKALVLEHEHVKIPEIKLNKTAAVESGTKTVLEKSLDDLGLKLGKTKDEMAQSLKTEIKQFGSIPAAEIKFKENPVVFKKEAPTLSSYFKHQENPNIQISTTNADDIISGIERRISETNEKVTARSAQRLEQEAMERGITKEPIKDLPTREIKHDVDQMAQYEILKSDPERLKRVAMGEENAPGNLKASLVWAEEANRAMKEGDVQAIMDLARSKVNIEGSEAGSFIQSFSHLDKANPVKVIKKLESSRTAKPAKIQKEVNNIKKAIKESAPNKDEWASFIESIKC